MPKSIQISDLNQLEFKSWSNVTYGKKICKGWGSRTFYHEDKSGNLYCKKFNLFQRIAHSFGRFGYKPDYSGKILLKHLQDKNIVKTPRKGSMDKLIACSLKTFKIECRQEAETKKAIRNEFVRQANDPAVTDDALFDYLKANPEISIHDKIDGFTPAFLAAKNKRLALLTYLVDQGVDVNVRCDSTNEVSITPLHAALEQSYLSMCEYLINNDADVNAQNAEGNTPMHLVLEMKAEHATIPRGTTNPKLHADDNTSGTYARFIYGMILAKNPDLNIVNHQQETAVMKAVKLKDYDVEDMLKIYDEEGRRITNPNASVNFVNENGDNALTFAFKFAGPSMAMANMLIDDCGAVISTHPQAKNILLLVIRNIDFCVYDIEKLVKAYAHLVTNEVIIAAIKDESKGLINLFLGNGEKTNVPRSLIALANVTRYYTIESVLKNTTDAFLQINGDEALIACINQGNFTPLKQIFQRYARFQPVKIPSQQVFEALKVAALNDPDCAAKEFLREL